eukprot:gene9789-biopygen2755
MEEIDNKSKCVKVLGLNWDLEEDVFEFKLSELAKFAAELIPTKRNVLRLVAKVFDPQGFISPVTTPLKVFLQKLFKAKLSWDETLPEALDKEWKFLISKLDKVESIFVPRYYFGSIDGKPDLVELFGFCDSSESAYVASVYAKITVNGKSHVSLVMSKSRVAPLSKTSIPRLELLACLTLARLIDSVENSLSPVVKTKVVKCWTDSISALYWILGEGKEWKIFVENRVQEIRKLFNPNLWSHCPGKENPADVPTRNYDVTKLQMNDLWWSGPEWLKEDPGNWPNVDRQDEMPQECQEEIRKNNVSQEKSSTVLLADAVQKNSLRNVIKLENFSSISRLYRVTSYVLRFLHNCRKKSQKFDGELSAEDMAKAELFWIKEVQNDISKHENKQFERQLVGVDFAGPLYVKSDQKQMKKREILKINKNGERKRT